MNRYVFLVLMLVNAASADTLEITRETDPLTNDQNVTAVGRFYSGDRKTAVIKLMCFRMRTAVTFTDVRFRSFDDEVDMSYRIGEADFVADKWQAVQNRMGGIVDNVKAMNLIRQISINGDGKLTFEVAYAFPVTWTFDNTQEAAQAVADACNWAL